MEPMRPWEWLLLLLCLALFGTQAVLSSQEKSATFDEEYHLTRGYAYLRTGDFRLSFSHPPLTNLWSSLPLLFLADIQLPVEDSSWTESDILTFADEFLWRSNENPQQMVALAKLPIVFLGIVLVLAMFWWARQLAGAKVSWVVLLLASFGPNLIAHSRLVTTDIGLTCFLLLAIWRLWCWLEKPSRSNIILIGLFAGAAMATKYSGLMAWPIMFFILLIYPAYNHQRLLALAKMGLVAFLVLWSVYLFDFGPLPEAAWNIPLPLPFYLSSLWRTLVDFEVVSRPAYLLGQISEHGWWYYFPIALLVKNSVPMILLSILGISALRRQYGWRRAAVLWLPFLFFLGLGMTGRLSIGYRHILPGIPFLIIMAGHCILWKPPRRMPAMRLVFPVLILLLVWHVFGTARIFPHYEAYFNEMAGGPANGHRVLVDSNLDWGQDLPALKQLLESKGIDKVNLSYFGTAPPELYGIHYQPLPSFPRFEKGKEEKAYNPYTPLPGWYAISATSLRLGLYLQNWELYSYFSDMEPAAQAGYSINLYEVGYPEDTAIERDLIIDQAVWDMPEDKFKLRPRQRLVAKWTQSANTSVSWPSEEVEFPSQFEAVGVDFADAFTLLGFAVEEQTINAGTPLKIELVWQVETADIETPAPTTADPLAAFIHVSSLNDPSDIVAQYDGWETALMGLERGDIIKQVVWVQVPEETPGGTYQIVVGLYSPQTWQRFTITSPTEAGDFVTLTPITIIGEKKSSF